MAILALPTAIENETSLTLAIEHSLAAGDVPLVIAATVGRREAKQGDDDRRQEQVAGEERGGTVSEWRGRRGAVGRNSDDTIRTTCS